MPGIFFMHPWILAGLTALGIPILIHLLLKRKTKRLRFSTLQFFVKQDEQSSRRRKLRNWLLLAMRLLLFTLLAFAFARPFLPHSKASDPTRPRRQVVFVIDRSASMRAVGTDGPRWPLGIRKIQKILSGLNPDDRAAVISCSTHTEVVSAFAPPATIARAIEDLQPSFGSSDLGDGLAQAAKLLLPEPNVVSTVYVASDLQRSACQNLASYPVPDEIQVEPLIAGDLFSPNAGITELQVNSSEGAKPHLVAANFSDEDISNLKLEVHIDGKSASTRAVHLPAGALTNVEFTLPVLSPGWHDVKASLQTKDALAADDTRCASLWVSAPARALVVESRKTNRIFEEETFFVRTALDPGMDSTNSLQPAYELQTTTPEELGNKLARSGGKWPCDLVIVPGLKQIPAGAASALQAFVQAGGGLVLFLGETVSANHYNSEFRDLLPAQLGPIDANPEPGAAWRIQEFDTNTLVFAAFRRPTSGDLHIPEFTKRHLLSPLGGAASVALFDDGIPLILTRAVGRGRVILVNTSADATWTDWPKHKTFVPWLHGIGKYLVQKADSLDLAKTDEMPAGDDLEIEIGLARRNSSCKLLMPDRKENLLTADDQGRLRETGGAAPGIYSLRDATGTELRRFAVNTPPPESDLAALSALDFQQQLVRIHPPAKATMASGLFSPAGNRAEFWRILLLGVLALLFIEEFAANRTSP